MVTDLDYPRSWERQSPDLAAEFRREEGKLGECAGYGRKIEMVEEIVCCGHVEIGFVELK